MCYSPASGRDQFLMLRLEGAQVLQVLALRALIDSGVELESELVLSAGKPKSQRTVAANRSPLGEALG